MEGVGDEYFRKAIALIGGFDEAVRDFIRVPSNAHIESLAAVYQADEIAPVPLAAQIMGSDPELMAAMAQALERRGAPRIDVNCGCPSNTVTGKGAGSSLLKNPNFLYEVVKSVVSAVSVPVTVKMRSGYENTSLFKENILAAQESGIDYLTLHPRTKIEGYTPPARWELIAEAKTLLDIPVIGNGDIVSVEDALRMKEMTQCDGWMIGRGSVMNPFLFHQIRARLNGQNYLPQWEDLVRYFETFVSLLPETMSHRIQVNKVKQLLSFLFQATPQRLSKRREVLTLLYTNPRELLKAALDLLAQMWESA